MRAWNGEGRMSMCRLSMEKGRRKSEFARVKIELELTMDRRTMDVLKKEVEEHRKIARKHGWDADWTEKDELASAISNRLMDLRVRYGEEAYDAEFNGYIDKPLSITAEVRGREECRKMACGRDVI